MATSSNATIQKLMDEAEALDPSDNSLEAKLALIAQKVADEQQKIKAGLSSSGKKLAYQESNLVDPAEAFACEGCQ